MTAENENFVKIIDGVLHERSDDPNGIILSGIVEKGSLSRLLTDSQYQRDLQSESARKKILEGLSKQETLPAITLGVRGSNFESRGTTFKLFDEVYIIDGRQRVGSTLEYLQKNLEKNVYTLATIHFNTNLEWERNKFIALNEGRLNISPSHMLYTKIKDYPALNSIYNLTQTDRNFVLMGKICWSQRMARGELLSALMLLKTNGFLHSHKVAARSSSVEAQAKSLETMAEKIGINTVRENMRTFFGMIDECFGLKTIYFRNSSPQLKGSFLEVMARLLSDHHDFWNDEEEKKLFINADLRRKIKQFPLNDPTVSNLAGSGGQASNILYGMILKHINSGKRVKRLRSRIPDDTNQDINEAEEGSES